MTGVVMTARVMADEPREALRQMILLGTEPEMLLRPIGTGMVRAVQDRFRAAEDAAGNPWTPLNPEYAAGKKRGAGILRGAAMAGGLMGSITRDVQGEEVAVGTVKKYGAIHQFGGIIHPRSAPFLVFKMGGRTVFADEVTIPARPYLGWGAAEDEVVMEVTEALFQRATARRLQAGARNIGGLF